MMVWVKESAIKIDLVVVVVLVLLMAIIMIVTCVDRPSILNKVWDGNRLEIIDRVMWCWGGKDENVEE